MEYTILFSSHIEVLSVQVNAAIKEGWRPIGGVSCAIASNPGYRTEYQYTQAMVREGMDKLIAQALKE